MKHKAPGPKKLTAKQLKNLPPNMTDFLTEIFNHALSAGYFPNSYEHATMTLIPKAGTIAALQLKINDQYHCSTLMANYLKKY